MERVGAGGTSVSDLINRACGAGMTGMSFCLQQNPRVVVVANRCFRVQCRAQADGEDAAVFSAFVSNPEELPAKCWKLLELEGKQLLIDHYTGRLLTGLGVQAWSPEGVDAGDSFPGVLVAFIHPAGGEYSDEETREAAEKMGATAAAAYKEIASAATVPSKA